MILLFGSPRKLQQANRKPLVLTLLGAPIFFLGLDPKGKMHSGFVFVNSTYARIFIKTHYSIYTLGTI